MHFILFFLLFLPEKADVVFLIGGGSEKVSFDQQKKFIQEIIKRMPVSQKYTKVGLLTPQKVGNDRVDLKYTVNGKTASNQVKAIKKPLTFDLKQTLKNVKEMFQEYNGARKNIPDIVIAFTNEKLLEQLPREQAALADLMISGVKIALIDESSSDALDRLPSSIRTSLAVIKIDSGKDFNTEFVLDQLVEKLKKGIL